MIKYMIESVITIDSSYSITFSWMYLDPHSDPDGTLSWFVKQLDLAEKAGDKVHVISHMPIPGGTLLRSWAPNYYKAIIRYEGTIRGLFSGHTHRDTYTIYYDTMKSSGRPVAVDFAGPSASTIDFRQPAYRVYTIDGARTSSTYVCRL